MATLAILLEPSDVAILPWAAQAAMAVGKPLFVLCVSKGMTGQLDLVSAEKRPPDTPPLVTAALEAVGALEKHEIDVHDCRGPDVRRAALDAIAELDAVRIVLRAAPEQKGLLGAGNSERIARAAPCEVLVIDGGSLPDARPTRVLVPQFGGGGEQAMLAALRGLASTEVPVLAVPDPEHLPRSRRVFARLCDRVQPERRQRLSQLEPKDAPVEATLSALLEDGDLVFLDANEGRQVPKHIARIATLRRTRPDVACAIALLRAADARGPGRLERLFERLRTHAPRLDRDQRKDLYSRVEAGGTLSADFVVMLALSTGIAALGLIQSSTATVIGAMLVAPLMTPLVAVGLAIVQGNLRMLQAALRAVGVGVVGGLLVALLIGALSPWDELSTEVLARGAPNLLDLGIALLSGMAAAYALARPGLSGTLVGVAIAVALVPPLAAAGIALMRGHPHVALGAIILFLTNFVAIILGTALMFAFFGLRVQRRDDSGQAWVRGAVMTLVLATLAVSAPLAQNLAAQMRQGASRPLAKPLGPALRQELLARIDLEPRAEVVLLGQTTDEDQPTVQIVLALPGRVPPSLRADLRAIVSGHLGPEAAVEITALRSADE